MAKTKTWDLRDPENRDAFVTAVKSCFKGKAPLAARDVQAQVGGDMNQIRRALNGLIEDGALTYTGQTRATRYARA